MNFFGKSILRRTFLYFFLFAALLGAVGYYFYSKGVESITPEIFLGSFFVFLIYFMLVYFFEIVRPINIILQQVRALLTGKKYKRIFTSRIDEIGILAHFFNEVTKSFEKVALDIKKGQRMMNELEIAAELQRDILPPTNPDIPGLDVVAKNRPAAELGGDNFDFITSGDDTYIYIGDVTGHGVPAALVMTMANAYIHTFVDLYDKAYDIVVNTNRQLKSRIKNTIFMTMTMLRWNHVTKTMSYVGAGHEHIIIFRASTGKCEVTKAGGIALGMVADNSQLVSEKVIKLNTDDAIVLYTDGITEGRNMEGDMYGLDRFVEAIEKYAPQYGAGGAVKRIAIDYSAFVGNHVQDDDVTLIIVKYVGEKEKNEDVSEKATAWTLENDVTEDEADKSLPTEYKLD